MTEVLWIDGNPSPSLAIVLCPFGTLRDELLQIKRSGVQTLVSLLEPLEADWLGLAEERSLAEEIGLCFLSHPIRDGNVPSDIGAFREFVTDLAERAQAGERIGLHCLGSIGRAPITAACTLIHLGWSPQDARAAIEAARGRRIPDTEEQLRWILNYKAQP